MARALLERIAMRAVSLGIALLAGCSFDAPVPPFGGVDAALPAYQLVPRGVHEVAADVVGVAWDGEALWVVTNTEIGATEEPDDMRVFTLDLATGARGDERAITTHADRPHGATWIDGQLWVHFLLSGDLVSFDPATGAETPRWRFGPQVHELDTDGRWLYAADISVNGGAEVRDPQTGQQVDELRTPEWQESLRGLAVVTPPGAAAPEIWGSSLATNVVPVLVGRAVVAHATFEGFGNNMAGQLTFAGQQLVLAMDRRVHVFDVVR